MNSTPAGRLAGRLRDLADLDHIAVLESAGADDALAKNARAVVRAEVNQHHPVELYLQPSVVTRGGSVAEAQPTVLGTTDQQLTRGRQGT